MTASDLPVTSPFLPNPTLPNGGDALFSFLLATAADRDKQPKPTPLTNDSGGEEREAVAAPAYLNNAVAPLEIAVIAIAGERLIES